MLSFAHCGGVVVVWWWCGVVVLVPEVGSCCNKDKPGG